MNRWVCFGSLTFLLLNLFGVISGCGPVDPLKEKRKVSAQYNQLIKHLHFSSHFGEQKKEVILNDLKFLSFERFDRSSVDTELKKVLHLPDTSSNSLLSWLSERLHVFVENSFNQNNHLSSATSVMLPFSNPTEFLAAPYFLFGASENEVNQDDDMQVVMSNLGTEIYVTYKNSKFLMKLTVPGVGKILVNTPRVGIIREGPGFFKPQTFAGIGNTQEIHYIIFRLATLFHEAGHDDGHDNEKQSFLGRQHDNCPHGHPYYRANNTSRACDLSINGSYMIGALITRAYMDSCENCSHGTLGALKLFLEDQLSRILINKPIESLKVEGHPQFLDDTPEEI
jgi:hypothetical protein